MKILLTTLNAKYIHTNIAIRLLYDLNKNYEGLSWKEFAIKEDKNQIASYCSNFDIIAFSCYIWNITPTLEVIKLIKKNKPNCVILLGGPEVSYEYNNIINLPEVDFIISGEGEIPFQEFIQNFPNINHIPGLVYKENNEIKQNPSPPIFDVKNFENTLFYEYDEPNSLKNKVLYLETSRGCPYKCEFCLASLDNKVRYFPMKTIKENLLFMMEHGRVIKFLDRTFNLKKEFTIDIFQVILDNYKEGNVFQFEITADILHPAIIEFINKKVPKGLFRFEIGIQTVNQKANLEVSRKQNFDKTVSIIKQVEDKVELHLDLIVGLALDYWEDIKYSIEEVFKLFAPELQLGFLKFLKGTPVRDKFEQHGFVFDPLPPYQIIESNYLSKEELRKIVLLEHALEIYWNDKKAVNTLKYVTKNYSIFDFLLGIGELFEQNYDLHQYQLKDIYDCLNQYILLNHSEDKVLLELCVLDYYLHFKVRPKQNYLPEIDKLNVSKLIDEHKLNHHQYRFVMLPISFDVTKFIKQETIQPKRDLLTLQFDGKNKPEILALSGLERV